MMKAIRFSLRSMAAFCMAAMLFLLATEVSDAGSFGGSRSSRGGGSFGGSRSRSGSSSGSRSSGGWFGSRSNSAPAPRAQSYPSQGSGSSFGGSRSGGSLYGSRLNSQQDYTTKYGAPRRQETRTWAGNDGIQRNVIVNSYGGYSDGLMMGYLMGHSSWFWYTPFHPAFYYSRPVYHERADGVVEYYPPTFSYGTLFFILLIAGVGVFIVYVVIRSRRRRRYAISEDYSQSSFG